MSKHGMKIQVEAFQYDGRLKDGDGVYYVPDWAIKAFEEGIIYYDNLIPGDPPDELFININSSEGVEHVSAGDYVVFNARGEVHSCKPDIFSKYFQ